MRKTNIYLISLLAALYGCQPDSKPQAAAATTAAPAQAVAAGTDAMQLAKKNNCFACHSIDKKVVGPSWKDVAAKYRGKASAEADLSAKIAKGGGGVWGAMPMPPFPLIGDEDRKTLVKFVLSLE